MASPSRPRLHMPIRPDHAEAIWNFVIERLRTPDGMGGMFEPATVTPSRAREHVRRAEDEVARAAEAAAGRVGSWPVKRADRERIVLDMIYARTVVQALGDNQRALMKAVNQKSPMNWRAVVELASDVTRSRADLQNLDPVNGLTPVEMARDAGVQQAHSLTRPTASALIGARRDALLAKGGVPAEKEDQLLVDFGDVHEAASVRARESVGRFNDVAYYEGSVSPTGEASGFLDRADDTLSRVLDVWTAAGNMTLEVAGKNSTVRELYAPGLDGEGIAEALAVGVEAARRTEPPGRDTSTPSGGELD